jgi:hypothetical protein
MGIGGPEYPWAREVVMLLNGLPFLCGTIQIKQASHLVNVVTRLQFDSP